MDKQILSESEIIDYYKNERLPENKLVQKYGQETMDIIGFLADGKKQAYIEKLNKNITFVFSLVQERNKFRSGPTYYQIAAFDGKTQVARIEYDIMEHGIHLSFVGIEENTGKQYQGKGIGYALLTELENNAQLLHEEFIEGIFCPIGKFKQFTEEFYRRNGYEFFRDFADHGRSCIYKKLKSQNTLSDETQPTTDS